MKNIIPTPLELRYLRESEGWTLEEAAEYLEVSPSTVHCWEVGKHSPTAYTIKKIKSVYNLDLLDNSSAISESALQTLKQIKKDITNIIDFRIDTLIKELKKENR